MEAFAYGDGVPCLFKPYGWPIFKGMGLDMWVSISIKPRDPEIFSQAARDVIR